MIDKSDSHTITLPGIKEPTKRGRKPIHSESMTAAERKARQRRLQQERIMNSEFSEWNESDCLMILTTKKYEAFHQHAWKRLGEIRGYF